jgi:DNA polymerase-3 subunit epsilon
MAEKIGEFREFIRGAVTVAHHAPFDLGFMALDFETYGIDLPTEPALCSSLLARRLFPESENHRLQTLVRFFALPVGTAHRALDDAKACLEVVLRCFERLGETNLARAFEAQGARIGWQRFSMQELQATPKFAALIAASRERAEVEMTYGSGKPRRVLPCGLVRSLDGDFVVAFEVDPRNERNERREKRFFLEKVESVQLRL